MPDIFTMPLDKGVLELNRNVEEQQSVQPKPVTFIHSFFLTTI